MSTIFDDRVGGAYAGPDLAALFKAQKVQVHSGAATVMIAACGLRSEVASYPRRTKEGGAKKEPTKNSHNRTNPLALVAHHSNAER